MKKPITIGVIVLFYTFFIGFDYAFAQFQQEGVDHPGEWYVGEGLREDNFFHYQLCQIDYKDCTNFDLSLTALENQTDAWNFEFHVVDGNTTVIEETLLDQITLKTTNSSVSLDPYALAYSRSLPFLSQFANILEPKAFSAGSWGKIGAIGGAQVVPTGIENVTVPAGTFESVVIEWQNGEVTSKVWVVDGFPYPVKAKTFAQVTTGIPPLNYEFELLSTCAPPSSGNWVITANCVLPFNVIAPANVIVQNDSLLTIPNGKTLDIDFTNFNLTVKSGSGVLIESGGAIT